MVQCKRWATRLDDEVRPLAGTSQRLLDRRRSKLSKPGAALRESEPQL